MTTPQESCSADDLLARRELLREQGVVLTIEDLCAGASTETRAEVARRLADVLAAERAIEVSWKGLAAACRRPFVPEGRTGRYVMPKVQAEGGMGVLCVAEDVELRRKVAYKVMKPGQDENPRALQRFFNEAEITAKLAHPGIVPVFGRVVDDSGLPAYASEFVHGHTLAAAIEKLHAIAPSDLAARANARAELLRAFISTCQIVAYAHSQKVIHGDIKPLNIMIDEFGATRLVDWGVARVAEHGLDLASEPAPSRPRPGTPTFVSSFDTPATFASDIYALGLTLMWIVADPPGNGTRPSRPAAQVPKALWAIALKATSDDHGGRYHSAAGLARDVQDVLDDKPVAAYRDRWPTRLRRFAARHRSTFASILALLFVAAIIGPLVGVRERQLRHRADTERLRALKLMSEMLDQAELVGKFQATLPGSKAILDRAVRLIDQLARDGEEQGADLRPAAANYHRAGKIHFNLNQYSEAAGCFERATELASRLVAASSTDADSRNLWALALRDLGVTRYVQGNADVPTRSLAKALEVIAPIADLSAQYRSTLARIQNASGNMAMLSHDQKKAQALFQQGLAVASKLVDESPADARFVKVLADIYSNQGMSLHMEALPDGRKLIAPEKLAAASASHRKALDHRRKLTRLEPGKPEHLADVAASLNHLANALLFTGEAGYANAESLYREALKILESLAIAFPGVPSNRQEVASVYSNLNFLLTRQNRADEATALGRAAVDLFGRLVADYPDTPELDTELGIALEQLAANLKRRGESHEAAARSYESAVAFARASNLTDEASQRAILAKKSLELLRALDAEGYFQNVVHADAVRDEKAFAALRDRPGFPLGKPGPPTSTATPRAPGQPGH
jgi:tetratricopeptide (TPR) repeat protein/tRNA A-37 threonylcarbamoyl transferase component Bud32